MIQLMQLENTDGAAPRKANHKKHLCSEVIILRMTQFYQHEPVQTAIVFLNRRSKLNRTPVVSYFYHVSQSNNFGKATRS